MGFDLATARPVESSGFDLSTATPVVSEVPSAKPIPGIGSDFMRRAQNVQNILTTNVPSSESLWDSLRKGESRALDVAGQGAGYVVNDLALEGLKSLYHTVMPQVAQDFLEKRTKAVIHGIGEVPLIREGATSLEDIYKGAQEIFPEGMKRLEAAGNIAMIPPIVKGAATALKAASAIPRATGKLLWPKPNPEQALGQVLQGKTKDLPKGKRALEAIDTSDVKTYSDLSKKLNDAIPDYARQVDAELMKDPKIYSFADLATVEKTKGGAAVTSNYVKDSLEHLQELYTKIEDPVRAGNMAELLAKAETQGLTRKEVNDIARIYGSEFGDKAFSRVTGDPLTSVNAQAYENVRTGLKDVARRGLSDTAKELDSTLSNIYNTRRLIDKNVEAANRLRQKIDERGLGEKIGRGVLTALDVATLGTAKGAVLKLLPRGLGYKVKNFIDPEDSLARNLKTITDELSRVEKVKPSAIPGPRVGPFVKSSDIDKDIAAYATARKSITGEEGIAGKTPIPYTESPLPAGTERVRLEEATRKAAGAETVQGELAGEGATGLPTAVRDYTGLDAIDQLQGVPKTSLPRGAIPIPGPTKDMTIRTGIDADRVILPAIMNQLKGKLPTWVEDRLNYLRGVTRAHWTADDWMLIRGLEARIKGEAPVAGGLVVPGQYGGKRPIPGVPMVIPPVVSPVGPSSAWPRGPSSPWPRPLLPGPTIPPEPPIVPPVRPIPGPVSGAPIVPKVIPPPAKIVEPGAITLSETVLGKSSFGTSIYKDGKLIGEGTFTIGDDGIAKVGMIRAIGGRDTISPTEWRNVLGQLKEKYPQITKFEGDRITRLPVVPREAEVAPPAAAGKQPWEMTKEEWKGVVKGRAGYKGLPETADTSDIFQSQFLKGRHNAEVTETTNKGYWGNEYELRMSSPRTNTVKEGTYFNEYDTAKEYPKKRVYDSAVVDSDLNIVDKRYKNPEDVFPSERVPSETSIFRGMSSAEFDKASANGKIESKGALNFSEQKGETYYARNPNQAASYAGGFAPWYEQPSFEQPGFIVQVKKPKNATLTSQEEVAVKGSVPLSEIEKVYELRLASEQPGQQTLLTNTYENIGGKEALQEGSSYSPSQHYVVREVPKNVWGDTFHKRQIKQALSEGKPVPPEVLADYPDLKGAEAGAAPTKKVIEPTKAEEKAVTTPKEQKVYVLEKTDDLISQARERWKAENAVGEKAKLSDKDIDERLLKGTWQTSSSPEGELVVTIDVPGDGNYRVPNDLRSLLQFKRNVKAMPVSTPSGKMPKPSTKPTGKPIDQITTEAQGEVDRIRWDRENQKNNYLYLKDKGIPDTNIDYEKWNAIKDEVDSGKRTLKSLAPEFGGRAPSGNELSQRARGLRDRIGELDKQLKDQEKNIRENYPSVAKEIFPEGKVI